MIFDTLEIIEKWLNIQKFPSLIFFLTERHEDGLMMMKVTNDAANIRITFAFVRMIGS